jgi:hypothetical protein
MSGMGNLVHGMGNLAQNKRSFPSINPCKLGPSGEAKAARRYLEGPQRLCKAGVTRRVPEHHEPVREADRVDDPRAPPTRGLVGGQSETAPAPRALVPAAVH